MLKDFSTLSTTMDIVRDALFEYGYKHAPSYSFYVQPNSVNIEMHFKLNDEDLYPKVIKEADITPLLSKVIINFDSLKVSPQSTRHLRIDVILKDK